jgi:hypothetical protein
MEEVQTIKMEFETSKMASYSHFAKIENNEVLSWNGKWKLILEIHSNMLALLKQECLALVCNGKKYKHEFLTPNSMINTIKL